MNALWLTILFPRNTTFLGQFISPWCKAKSFCWDNRIVKPFQYLRSLIFRLIGQEFARIWSEYIHSCFHFWDFDDYKFHGWMCNAHPVVKPNLVMNCSSVDAYCMCNWWRVIVYLKPTSTLCYSHIVHLRSLWLKAYVNMSHFQSMRHLHQSYKSDSSPVGEHLKPHCTPECFLSCFMLIAHSFGPWKCSQRIPHCQQKFDILP